MTEQEYLELTRETANDRTRYNLTYLTLGLCSEAGELADLRKKAIATDTPYAPLEIIKELGDVLWYLTRMADTLDVTLEAIREVNAQKLRDRQVQGTLVDRTGRTDPRSYGP